MTQVGNVLEASTPGEKLRAARRERHMSLRDVHEATVNIAKEHDNFEYVVPRSKLSEIEILNKVPSLYTLQALSKVYGIRLNVLLAWFGIN